MADSPVKGSNIFSDIRNFFFKKPKIDTLVNISSAKTREDFSYRILQRIGQETEDYKLLNIHKVSVNIPVMYVFDEVLNWNWESAYWPSHITKFIPNDSDKHDGKVYLFRPLRIRKRTFGYRLFKLKLIKLHETPYDCYNDNARYLVYRCSGGYPIGLFSIYARSSIADMKENGMSQLFFVVGFNFFGIKLFTKIKFIKRLWEIIHNRVTANVLNRFKQLCEARFEDYMEDYPVSELTTQAKE